MKVSVSTSVEEEAMTRIAAVAGKTHSSEAAILRWCVMEGLPSVEREVLGAGPALAARDPKSEAAA